MKFLSFFPVTFTTLLLSSLLGAAPLFASAGQAGSEDSPIWVQFLPLILVFAIFFFLMILPQQRKMKKHRLMISNLKKGDEVITSAGIYAKVVRFSEDKITLYLEVADKVVVRVGRENIAQVLSTKKEEKEEKEEKK